MAFDSRLQALLATLASVAALGSLASAGGVRIVDAGGAGSYLTIQEAVDAAADGDVLLVGHGDYPGFVLNGKGLAIVAAPGADVQIQQGVEILDLPPGSTVVLSRLNVVAEPLHDGIRASSCGGRIHIFDCSASGGRSEYASSTVAGAGLSIEACADVAVARCTLRGGSTQNGTHRSGAGLRSVGSSFTVHESQVRGGDAEQICCEPTDGGHGCDSSGSWFFAAGSNFRGGLGENGCEFGADLGEGGSGLVLDHPAASLLCAYSGGNGWNCSNNVPAPPIVGTGLQFLPGSSRSIELPAASGDRRALPVTFRGQPGDRVFLASGGAAGFVDARELSGVWRIDPTPELLGALPLGSIGPTATLTVDVPLATLPSGSVREGVFFQGIFQNSVGELRLSDSAYLLLLNARSQPDCDLDGVQDYVAVLDGVAPDVDDDLVPDDCQSSGPIWYVDASAPPGGDGSQAQPFQAIGEAFAVATDGQTIRVADGVYTGPANRDLDFAGRRLTVESEGGPAGCIVDCQNAGRAFLLTGEPDEASVLRGFTIRRGDATAALPGAASGMGGGIVAVGGPARIEDCVVVECRAYPNPSLPPPNDNGYGGGIYVYSQSPRRIEVSDCTVARCAAEDAGGGIYLRGSRGTVRRTRLVDNEVTHATEFRGGGGIFITDSGHQLLECVVSGNASNQGGGGVWASSTSCCTGPTDVCCLPGSCCATLLSHCRIAGNQALRGGGAYLAGDSSSGDFRIEVHDCLVSGNLAAEGGGLFKFGRFRLDLASSTFDANVAATPGGALTTAVSFWPTGDPSTVSNCVFWRNASPGDVEIRHSGPGVLAVRHCDVHGGPAGIVDDGPGSLALGAGLLAMDPLYVDPLGPDGDPATTLDNDYRLAPGSPCVDAGSNADVLRDAGDIDGDGDTAEPSPLDLGLLPRFMDDPAIPDTGSGAPPIVDLGAHERQP